jgi:hypothetical protein
MLDRYHIDYKLLHLLLGRQDGIATMDSGTGHYVCKIAEQNDVSKNCRVALS